MLCRFAGVFALVPIALAAVVTSPCAQGSTFVLRADDAGIPRGIVTVLADERALFGDRDPATYRITVRSGQTAKPGQWFPPPSRDEDGELVFVLESPPRAGESRDYTVSLDDSGSSVPAYEADRAPGDSVTLYALAAGSETAPGRRPVLRYNEGIQLYEPAPESHLSRSGYLHPLWSPSGHVVTGDRCPDHPHQRGCFFAWTSCTFRDESINFWALETARPRTSAPPDVTLGPVAAQLVAHHELVAGPYGGEVEPVVRETLTYRVYCGLAEGWLIDITVLHETIGDPLWVEKYVYGGMAFRGPASWLDASQVEVSSGSGLPGRSADLARSAWCQMIGPAGEGGTQQAGVTYFDQPGNPRYPTPLRVHPEKPYFCFAYQQREGLCVDRTHPVRLRYRILVHDGRPDVEWIQRLAEDMKRDPVRLADKKS